MRIVVVANEVEVVVEEVVLSVRSFLKVNERQPRTSFPSLFVSQRQIHGVVLSHNPQKLRLAITALIPDR